MIWIIIIGVICATLCAILAGSYGRSPGAWAALGFLFGIFALLALAVMGKVQQ